MAVQWFVTYALEEDEEFAERFVRDLERGSKERFGEGVRIWSPLPGNFGAEERRSALRESVGVFVILSSAASPRLSEEISFAVDHRRGIVVVYYGPTFPLVRLDGLKELTVEYIDCGGNHFRQGVERCLEIVGDSRLRSGAAFWPTEMEDSSAPASAGAAPAGDDGEVTVQIYPSGEEWKTTEIREEELPPAYKHTGTVVSIDERAAAEIAIPRPMAAKARGGFLTGLGNKITNAIGGIKLGWKTAPILFGVNAPTRCVRGSQFGLHFAAYVPSMRRKVARQLREAGSATNLTRLDISPQRGGIWNIGTPFVVRPGGRYFTSEPPEATFDWNGTSNMLGFAVTIDPGAPPRAVLTVVVLVEGVTIASIAWEVAATSTGSSSTRRKLKTLEAPSSAFASYASKDMDIVAQKLSALAVHSPTLDIYQDCLDLKMNEEFKPNLEREIGARGVFWLFWSRNAAASHWVRWEYTTALAVKPKKPIEAMPLEDPIIAPLPPEFVDIQTRDRYLLAAYGLKKIKEIAAENGPPPAS